MAAKGEQKLQTADGYNRVSRVAGREGEAFISPDVQRKKIEAWADLHSVEIVSWWEDNFEGSTPMGRFAIGILTLIAELELERITESWATANKKAVESGFSDMSWHDRIAMRFRPAGTPASRVPSRGRSRGAGSPAFPRRSG